MLSFWKRIIPIGGFSAGDAPLPVPNYFHFHAVFGGNWPGNRLASPLWDWRLPPPGSATDTKFSMTSSLKNYHLINQHPPQKKREVTYFMIFLNCSKVHAKWLTLVELSRSPSSVGLPPVLLTRFARRNRREHFSGLKVWICNNIQYIYTFHNISVKGNRQVNRHVVCLCTYRLYDLIWFWTGVRSR